MIDFTKWLDLMCNPNYWGGALNIAGTTKEFRLLWSKLMPALFKPLQTTIRWLPEVLPYALSVLGVTIAVFFAIKFIKKIMK